MKCQLTPSSIHFILNITPTRRQICFYTGSNGFHTSRLDKVGKHKIQEYTRVASSGMVVLMSKVSSVLLTGTNEHGEKSEQETTPYGSI